MSETQTGHWCAQCLLNGSGRFRLVGDVCENPDCVMRRYRTAPAPEAGRADVLLARAVRAVEEYAQTWEERRAGGSSVQSLEAKRRADELFVLALDLRGIATPATPAPEAGLDALRERCTEAREAGYAAYSRNSFQSLHAAPPANPYPEGSLSARSWDMGWSEARAEHEMQMGAAPAPDDAADPAYVRLHDAMMALRAQGHHALTDELVRLVGEAHREGLAAAQAREVARPKDEWSDDDGSVLWWTWPVTEEPYVGTPLDSGFPSSVTHWTPLAVPTRTTEAQ